MMKDKVIQTAGKVWRTLGEKGPISIAQLAKLLKLKADITNQAIGWLAREDKIKYVQKGASTFVCLVDTEQQMFNIVNQTPAQASK